MWREQRETGIPLAENTEFLKIFFASLSLKPCAFVAVHLVSTSKSPSSFLAIFSSLHRAILPQVSASFIVQLSVASSNFPSASHPISSTKGQLLTKQSKHNKTKTKRILNMYNLWVLLLSLTHVIGGNRYLLHRVV